MSNFLRSVCRTLPVLAILVAAQLSVQAQVGCNGFDGAPQPSGGVNSISNGTLCLNAASPLPAEIEIIATNVADGNNPNNFAVVINWDDGSPEQVIAYGGAITVQNTGPHAYRIPSIKHQFLPRDCGGANGRQCAYKPRVYLRIAGVRCGAEFGNPPDFFRFNTDDQCSGAMRLSEDATNATVFEVCAGVESTVRMRDRTRLNCLPPQEITGLNATRRWRRFVYGTTNTITGAVKINGVTQTFPFNAAAAPTVSGNTLTSSNPPYANNLTETITIPATAQAGQEFHVRLQYWNFCNQFTDGAAPRTYDAIIRVVAQPSAPTPVNQVVCNGTSPLPTFRVNFAAASSAVLWYRDNAGVPGAAITNPNGGNNKDLPASAFPGGINTSTAGVYRVWAAYRAQVGAGSLQCQSALVPVTLTIKESIPTPGPISGTSTICNGATGQAYSVPVTAGTLPFGGATSYSWDVDDGAGNVRTDVTLTPQADGRTVHASFNITNATFGGASSITRRIRVRRSYNTNSTFPSPGSSCSSNRATYTVTIYRNTDDGTISGGGTFCQGEDLGNVTWTPGVGTIQRWELSSGGAFVTQAALGTGNPVNPSVLNLAPGTYNLRAVIKNGTCVEDPTDNVSFTILANPAVSNAGPDQNLCIPAGALTANLAGNAPGMGVTGTWSKISGPGTTTFSNASAFNSTVTASLPGTYVLRWTLNNGSCNSVDNVTIQFGRNPATPVPTGNDVCGVTANLSSAAPVNGEAILWSTATPGVTFDAATAQNTSVTVPAPGTYTFNLQYTTACGSTNADVTVDFGETLTVDTGDDIVQCVDAAALGPIALTGTVTGGAYGGGSGQSQWQSTGAASGTFTSSGGTTGASLVNTNVNDSYTPSPADYAAGSVTLRLVAQGGTCASVNSTITITLDRQPAAAAVAPDISTCGESATLNAVAPTESGVGTWSVITAGPSLVDPSNRGTVANDLELGANQFTWTVESEHGTCPSTSATFTVTRIEVPVAFNISPSDLCESGPNTNLQAAVDLSARYDDMITGAVPGLNVEWYRNAARTIQVPDVNSEDVADGSIYYTRVVTSTSPVCSADGIATFTVNPLPFVANLSPARCEDGGGLVSNVSLVALENDVELNVPGRTTSWFTDAALTTAVPNAADVDNIANNDTFYAVVSNDVTGCSNVAEVKFIVNPLPTGNPIDGPNNICYDPNEVHFFQVQTFKPNHTYEWVLPASVTNVTGVYDDFFVTVQFPVSGPGLQFKVKEISGAGCVGPEETITINVESAFSGLTITPSKLPICEGEEDIEFETQNFPYNYIWTVPPGATIIEGQGSNLIKVNMGTLGGDVVVTPNTNNCTGPAATLPVTVSPRPRLLVNPAGYEICSDVATNIQLNVEATSEPATSYILRARVDGAGLTTALPSVPPELTGDENLIRNDVFTNVTGGNLPVSYTIVPVSAVGCQGAPRVLPLTVKPEPQLDPNLGKELCSDEATAVVLRTAAGKAVADRYTVVSITNAGGLPGTNEPTLGVPLSELAIRDNAWENITNSSHTISYFIRPINTSTGCEGKATQLDFPIRQKPVFVNVVNPIEICSETDTNIELRVDNVPTASITWTLDYVGPNIQGATAGFSGTPPAFIHDVLTNNSTSTADIVRYRVVAENAVSAVKSCFSQVLTQQVIVNPLPDVTPPLSLEACADAPNNGLFATVDLTSLNDGIAPPAQATITWRRDALDPLTEIGVPTGALVQNLTNVYAIVKSTAPAGCEEVVPVKYTVHNAVSFNLSKDDVTCAGSNDGKIRATVLTGTAPYNFQVASDPPVQAGSPFIFSNLAAGPYTVTIVDHHGCSASDNSQTILEPGVLSATESHVNVSCFFDSNTILDRNGSISITALGGPSAADAATAGNYQFTLLPGNVTNTTGVFSNLRPGIYTVRVADGTNTFCRTEIQSINVTVPTAVEVLNVGSMDISCFGQNDGEVGVTVQGGTGSYIFTLNPTGDVLNEVENVEARFTNLGPAVYSISIVDGNNCRAPQTSAVVSPVSDFTPGAIGSSDDICPEEAPVPLTEVVQPFGGSNSFEYLWQFSFTGSVSDPENDLQWSSIGTYSSSPSAATLDPTATLDPNRAQPEVRYRRLVRAIPTRANPAAACLTPKSSNLVLLRNRPEPVVQIVAPASVCEGVESFIYLQMVTGTAPMTFDIFDGDIMMVNQSGGTQSPLYAIKNPAQTPTLYFDNIRDAYGCKTGRVEHMFDFQKMPSFTVVNPQQCAEQEFEFVHTPDPNLQYQWIFGDGSTPETYFGDNPPTLPIKHTYPAGSTSVNTQYTVKLTAFGACPDHSFSQQVTIFPTIARNIIEPETNICDGETVTFTDNSAGVTSSTWQYQYVDDNGDVITSAPIVPAGPQVQFSLPNATNQNPVAYTILYNAQNNQGCGTSQTLGPVKVYKTPVASFTNLPAEPEMIGGVMEVEYAINDYAPAFFNYSWIDPGMHLVPGSESFDAVNGVRTIQYAREEDITITLVVANALMPRCASQDIQIIPIKLNSPTAGFVATPLVGCFPVTVTTQNTSVSFDQFEWVLTSAHSNEERSMLREPQFRISQPGVYTLTMLARKTGTTVPPQYATPRTITVFEQPYADFLLRMPQVFLGEPVEPINRSLFAQSFLWDFGDGETSIEIQPRHTYRLEGKDSITLIAYFDHGAFDLDGDGIIDGNVVCADTTKQAIRIIAGGALKIPNAFTPSANGPNSGHEDLNFTNDVFLPIMDGVEEFTMQIYDRWGTLVFESRDKNIGWNGYDRNGRLMPAGVYVYKLVLRLGDGQRTTQVGDVTLIR